MDTSKLYIAHPGHGRVFHVYGEDDQALCGRSMMLRKVPELCDTVTDETRWVKGQDCKACFRKAGLISGEESGG